MSDVKRVLCRWFHRWSRGKSRATGKPNGMRVCRDWGKMEFLRNGKWEA